MDKRDDPQHKWMRSLAARTHPHTAVCALANKLVRISWALLRKAEAVFNRGGRCSMSRWPVQHRDRLIRSRRER